ncbi:PHOSPHATIDYLINOSITOL-GLYCAN BIOSYNTHESIS CLASS W PROTEIN [Salix koriyanagi]|uniref:PHOSPHATIDYLINOSITOL-GLYCAN BIOSYNTHESIS CLASS W PROTEIN n=1 Tax=Salix koriyanagi TaxID=2511006 RepID=A0A9Q0PWY8_9ROSI|nr:PHOSPHATIDYLINOSITOL-GLYCAN BIOSYNTHESIS CLASS W PROTEIN [Salix koriyanagi]
MDGSLNPNKHLKEQFVSNLTGSSMFEIAVMSTVAPLLSVLRHSICSSYQTVTPAKKNDHDNAILGSKKLGNYVATLSVDFLFIVLPMLLIFHYWVYMFVIPMMVLVFSVVTANRFDASNYPGGPLSLRTNVSSYRVLMMIITFLCILAVDFKIFPRRHAKTETYGTSLMDLGVGSFIFANALVSRQARSVSSANWKAAVQSTSPLLLLGFARLLTTRSVDYQVHTGEYGVHWNFFFTLAAVSILTSIIKIPPQYSGIFGVAILIGFQYWLSHGLNVYLLSDERGTNILSKNKEGIFSILGYWGLYLVGVQLGYYLFFGNRSTTAFRTIKWARVRVSFISLVFWLVTVLLDRHVERVSRRMCNLAYVTLVLAQNLQVLAILMLSDFNAGSKISALEEALNRNLLGSFLLANLLTGLVNLYVDTLFIPSFSALAILLAYAYCLSIITGIAGFYGVKLKFW